MKAPRASLREAFTLLEVVIAISVFAIGMIAVVGLLAPVARSVTSSSDAAAAARAADAVREKLRSMTIANVAPLLKNSTGARGHELTDLDARPDYDLTKDAQLLFASRDGSKIGTYSDPVWIDPTTKRASDRDKFFEIALIRNETLSPKSSATAATDFVLAYVARIRWPAFVADATGSVAQFGSNPTGAVKFDHGRKQVLFVAGAVTR